MALTDSIALLRTQLGQPSPSTSDELVQRLLRWRANTRTATTVDDDIALIAATRR